MNDPPSIIYLGVGSVCMQKTEDSAKSAQFYALSIWPTVIVLYSAEDLKKEWEDSCPAEGSDCDNLITKSEEEEGCRWVVDN